MTVMAKAVLPGRERAWLAQGSEVVAGFVVRADDVSWAQKPAQLVEAFGLDFPGSPLSEESDVIAVVRFPTTGTQVLINALGGNDVEVARRVGGRFVEPAPFTGTGFVRSEHVVPLWWMNPTRIPAGAQLWHHTRTGDARLVAVYPHIGIGWQLAPGVELDDRSWAPVDSVIGTFGEFDGHRMFADVLADGRIVIASHEEFAGAERSARGLWWRIAEPGEIAQVVGVQVTARWQGLEFQVTDRRGSESGQVQASLVYLGGNAFVAERAGLAKTDQGVYEAVVAWDELTDVQVAELIGGDQ